MRQTVIILIFILSAVMGGIPASVQATGRIAALTNPQVLALPSTAWPAGTVMEEGRVIDAAAADSGLLLLSAIVARSQTYTSAGMTSGYFQRYARRDSTIGDVLAYWMPTLYATSAQADTMVELGKQAIGRHATPAANLACPVELPTNCTVFVTTSVGNTVRVGYAVWSMDNVLAEAAIVAYAGTAAFPLDAFAADLTTLVQAGNTTTNAALHPVPTATDTAVSTPTPTPVRPTSVPANTRSATPTATATLTPSSTPTATMVPLFVSVRVRRHTVPTGAQQTILVTTLPRAGLVTVVTFPDGATKRHQGTAGLTGAAVWSFRQPARHTTPSGHTARVVVTARVGSRPSAVSSTRYSIR
jgi:hypothetical protein